MKIIVAHEGKQHSFKTAEALHSNGYLFKYITTIYDKPYSLTRLVKNILKGNMKKKCASHRTDKLPDNLVLQYYESLALLRLLLSKIPFIYRYFPGFYDLLHDNFGREVAKYAIKHNVDAVVMYDTNANACFRILKEKAPYIKRVLDVTIANRLFTINTYLKDLELYNDSKILEEIEDYSRFETSKERFQEELELTDIFLVGSVFVKNSLLYSGVEQKKIKILPYGVNLELFTPQKIYNTANPLKLIFVGSVCYRKGIHHLLSVVSHYSSEDVELDILGDFSTTSDYYKNYDRCKNIHFIGFVNHESLVKAYNEANVFVLPSLSEGFAQVSLEAMSCGLPIICTTNSGCNDAVIDYVNGFVIEPSNRNQLKEKIDWFINNKEKIKEMGQNARKKALNYSWDEYCKGLIKTIDITFNS